MALPLIIMIITALGGALLVPSLLLGSAGALAILFNAKLIAWIIGGVVGLFIIKSLFK